MALNYSIEVCTDDHMHEWKQVAQASDGELAMDIGRMVAGRYLNKLVEVNGVKGDGSWETVHSFFVDAINYVENDNGRTPIQTSNG